MRTPLASVIYVSALVAALAVVATLGGSGCVVPDPEYCSNDDSCAAQSSTDGTRRVCHPARHVCVETGPGSCVTNEDCTNLLQPRCDLATSTCAACLPNDSNDTSCGRISESAKCTAVSGGEARCVECGENLDCPAARPICDTATNQCRPCREHTDCVGELNCEGNRCTDSLVCLRDGELPEGGFGGYCASNTTSRPHVMYVKYMEDLTACNNLNTTNDGLSPQRPVCQLKVALQKAKDNNIRHIRLLVDLPISLENFNTGPWFVIGSPSFGSTKNVQMEIKGGPLLNIESKGNLTLDHVDIMETSDASNPIACGGFNGPGNEATLRILSSTISGATLGSMPMGSVAIVANRCILTIDRCVIGVSKKSDTANNSASTFQYAMFLDDPASGSTRPIVVQNSVFAGNLRSAVLFTTSNAATNALFQFNTFLGNGRTMPLQAGAVECPNNGLGASILFANNLFIGNQRRSDTGSQVYGGNSSCTFHNNVIDPSDSTTAAGFTKGTVDLGDDLRLTSAGDPQKLCIDKATARDASNEKQLPTYDLDGTPRPSPTGGKWDIGATEVK